MEVAPPRTLSSLAQHRAPLRSLDRSAMPVWLAGTLSPITNVTLALRARTRGPLRTRIHAQVDETETRGSNGGFINGKVGLLRSILHFWHIATHMHTPTYISNHMVRALKLEKHEKGNPERSFGFQVRMIFNVFVSRTDGLSRMIERRWRSSLSWMF